MRKSLFRRGLGAVFALALMLMALPATAQAVQTADFTLIDLVATDVTLDETNFEYTGSEIKSNVTVTAGGKTLTLGKDYTLEYADNVEVGTAKVIVTGIGTASATVGYNGTVEHPFFIHAKAPEYSLVEIKAADVTIEGTEFTYTGDYIKPGITVTVNGRTLTEGQDYSLTYVNNIEIGTGTAIIKGIANAETGGYTGEVKINFSILKAQEEYPLVEIKANHVAMEGNAFPYTGKAVEPKITVTVDGKVLTAGKDYSLKYLNNTEIGTATAVISGIATATQNGGYTGEVKVNFTIVDGKQEYPLVELKASHVALEGTEFAYTGKAIEPNITVTVDGKVLTAGKDYSLKFLNNVEPGTATAVISGIATATETSGYTGEVKVDFTIVKAPQYKITKGDGKTWYQGSTKTLSFTANGEKKDFTKLTIDGKTVSDKYYTVKEGSTVVTLNASLLEKLELGEHTIVLHFTDGEAEGTFHISDKLDPTNPSTGDDSHIGMWICLSFISLAGAAVMLSKRIRSL